MALSRYTRSKVALSLSSWFCVPEQGMKDFEILNRASAFIVPAKSSTSKLHVLTASHAVAPWRWPKYYPEEWLKYINEDHTYYTLELRTEEGIFITQNDCLTRSFHHSNRDLACLHFEDDNRVLEFLNAMNFETLNLEKDMINKNDVLSFHGHEVIGEVSNEFDERKPYPYNCQGVFINRTKLQSFARTPEPLTLGMCGGPVLNKSNKVVGLLEGIVPVDHPSADLRGLAVFVENNTISQFVNDVENKLESRDLSNKINDRVVSLVGGKAAIAVSKDKDPAKMDLGAIVRKLESEEFDAKEAKK